MGKCAFCGKEIELKKKLNIFSKYKNVCIKCENGVKAGIVVGAMLIEEMKKPRTIMRMGKTKMIKQKVKIRRRG